MLNEKKLLTKQMTVENVTPSSISDFITVNSGFTVSNLSALKYGRLLILNCTVKRSTSWAAGSTGTVGTIKSGYRPVVNSGGASATFRELIGTDGRLYLRPATDVGANSEEAVTIMYALA